MEIKIYSRALNQTFDGSLNLEDRTGRVTIEGNEIPYRLREETDPKIKGLYASINVKDLSSPFVAKMKKVGVDLAAFQRKGQPMLAKLVDESASAVEKAISEARINEEANLKAIAADVKIVGWAYIVGCDTSDSSYFVYSQEVSWEVKSFVSTPDTKLINQYINHKDLQEVKEKFGIIGQVAPNAMSYGGDIFSIEAFNHLQTIAQTREGKIIAKQKAEEDAKLEEGKRVKGLAKGREIINVVCESRPHLREFSSAILNSPAPNGGNFLVTKQIDKSVWNKMKEKGARYYSSEMLEDFDMFRATPGWRYSIAAIGELIKAGFAIKLEREVFVSVDSLFNFYKLDKEREN